MKKTSVISIFIVMGIISCEKDLKTEILVTPKLCFNCVLNPDSLIHGSLSLSQSISEEKIFVKIDNASIELKKEGQVVGKLQNTGNGIYSLDIKPWSGSLYEITIKADGFPELCASTFVPKKPLVTYQLDNPVLHASGQSFAYTSYRNTISIHDTAGVNRYWLYRLSEHPSMGLTLSAFIDVNSPLVDDFNKVIDSTFPLGYYYDYSYLRINDTSKDGLELTFSTTNYNKDVLFFMDADEHYDKYLKSTIKQKMNNNDLLFNEPVQIYSNIENGLGIFGSAAITSFKL